MQDDQQRQIERTKRQRERLARPDEERRRSRKDTEHQLVAFLSEPHVECSLNVRVDLTMKQRRDTELVTRRPRNEPKIRYHKSERVETFVPAANTGLNVHRYAIQKIDDDEVVNVRVPARRLCLNDAPLFAPFYYLTEEETRRIAVRVVNRLNRELFGNRARRTNNPERLTALICHHDRRTRRHLHCLFAVPATVADADFRNALSRAMRNEPFLYRVERFERVRNLTASILYNTNERKALSGTSILYQQTYTPTPDDTNRSLNDT
jgi:hypothetical protein